MTSGYVPRASAGVGNLGWDLTLLGPLPVPVADLVRIAAAAYLADRRAYCATTFSRSLELTVHTHDPVPWNSRPGELLSELLTWLTGDAWTTEGHCFRGIST
ncbi:hypothetical protein GCM10010193_23900 [Kitasatospora atroaurantiaca]